MSDAGSARGALAGFLAMCFAVVGFTGMLAAHVGRLPLERAVAREAVLDEVLARARAADHAGLAALKPRLGDSAVVLPGLIERGSAGIEAAVTAERVAMRARQMAQADATATRLRVLLVLVTLMGGAFGLAMLLAASRQGRATAAPRVAADGGIG
jgi:hypothetical protein